MKVLKIVGIVIGSIIIVIGLFFGLGYVLTSGEYTVPETVEQDSKLPRLTIDGVTYHGETYGSESEPVVIVLHGGPGADYRSTLSLKNLSDAYYVVFYDQRGSGLSPRGSIPENAVETFISDLDSFVEHYGNGEAVNLVGHSWGAMLASMYIGRYPDKVDHAVLAEPGFLTDEFAQEFFNKTRMKFSFKLLRYFLRCRFEALHISSPDSQASDDYFVHQLNLYDGPGHPQAGYRCPGQVPDSDITWRNGALIAEQLFSEAFDKDGRFILDLSEGVEFFENQILFLTGECQQIIGAEYQRRQMALFNHAELAVIPGAGHEMFAENPGASVSAVRSYLDSPTSTGLR